MTIPTIPNKANQLQKNQIEFSAINLTPAVFIPSSGVTFKQFNIDVLSSIANLYGLIPAKFDSSTN